MKHVKARSILYMLIAFLIVAYILIMCSCSNDTHNPYQDKQYLMFSIALAETQVCCANCNYYYPQDSQDNAECTDLCYEQFQTVAERLYPKE